ncbi:UNVERIFIED_CONTAM: hypothetical protein FKN15_074558 [Acipenser sinensis]
MGRKSCKKQQKRQQPQQQQLCKRWWSRVPSQFGPPDWAAEQEQWRAEGAPMCEACCEFGHDRVDCPYGDPQYEEAWNQGLVGDAAEWFWVRDQPDRAISSTPEGGARASTAQEAGGARASAAQAGTRRGKVSAGPTTITRGDQLGGHPPHCRGILLVPHLQRAGAFPTQLPPPSSERPAVPTNTSRGRVPAGTTTSNSWSRAARAVSVPTAVTSRGRVPAGPTTTSRGSMPAGSASIAATSRGSMPAGTVDFLTYNECHRFFKC